MTVSVSVPQFKCGGQIIWKDAIGGGAVVVRAVCSPSNGILTTTTYANACISGVGAYCANATGQIKFINFM